MILETIRLNNITHNASIKEHNISIDTFELFVNIPAIEEKLGKKK